jgi:hypothetical protein
MMDTRDDGGSAFPQSRVQVGEDNSLVETVTGGMSLRDWFAGQALAGLVRSEQPDGFPAWVGHALDAYALADAMLEARK